MSKTSYQPKVGETCIIRRSAAFAEIGKISYIGNNIGCYETTDGKEHSFVTGLVGFEQIPTVDEKLQNELCNIITEKLGGGNYRNIARIVLEAGYRKPVNSNFTDTPPTEEEANEIFSAWVNSFLKELKE